MGGLINVMEPCCAAGGSGGGGGISIGDSVGGGAAKRIPFIDASGNLAQDAGLIYDASIGALGASIVNGSTVFASNYFFGGVAFVDYYTFRDHQGTRIYCEADKRITFGSPTDHSDASLGLSALNKKPYTVGTLPVAPSAYDQCLVVDALAPAIGSVVVGGGSVAANVIWISPNWLVM